ncbi:MAG: hypothetical protein H7Z39_06540, partial [Burkholderiaceae bacterium]|nr:hypothetical protein [Burkholderiaceae bacterium]
MLRGLRGNAQQDLYGAARKQARTVVGVFELSAMQVHVCDQGIRVRLIRFRRLRFILKIRKHMKFFKCLLSVLAVLSLSSCASWHGNSGAKQTGSIVDYLYPKAKEPPAMQASVTRLRPPVRVGVAFVPGGQWSAGLPETEKMKLLERVKSSFSKHAYIGNIEIIPTQYLRSGGGFTNLEQVAR